MSLVRKRRFFLSLAALPLAGCRSAEEKEADASLKKTHEAMLQPFREEERLKEAYARRNTRYRCEATDVPAFSAHQLAGVMTQAQPLDERHVLRLRLGRFIKPSGDGAGNLRTASRYQLAEDGTNVCDAESLLTNEMDADVLGNSETRLFWHAGSSHLLVAEEREWSNERHVVMWPVDEGGRRQWHSKLIDVPLRGPRPGVMHNVGEVLGAANGMVYVEVDGNHYAFPLNELETDRLEFGIG